jgi:hypothetical protein
MIMRSATSQWFPRVFRTFLFLPLTVLPQFLSAGNAAAQTVRGHLHDAETGAAVINGTVALRDGLGAVVARTATDEEGRFVLTVPGPGRFSLHAAGLGYRSAPSDQFVVGEGDEATIDLSLSPEPIPVPGFDVGGGTFQERWERVQDGLDMRLADQPGESLVVGPERVRLYDNVHRKDPYKLLWRELRAGWHYNQSVLRFRRPGGRTVNPEVYLDDRRIWLLDLVLTPNSELCRVEMYEPPLEYWDLPAELQFTMAPFQIRAYTCHFMTHVATGARRMRTTLNWGDLIAGPGGG